MPKKSFKEDQIVRILREADTGLTIEEICRKHEISRNTYYRWRKIYGGLDVDGARDARRLLEENRKLKKKLAELMLEVDDLKMIVQKKW